MELLGLELQAVWLVFPLIGCIAGLLAGMLGLGGGIVLVPGLYFFLKSQELAAGYEMQFALGTSLGCIVPTSLSATLAHQRQKNINWNLYKRLVPGFLLGGILGALLADSLSSTLLEKVFGLLCLLIALRILVGFAPKAEGHKPLQPITHAFNGTLMGGIAALTGVGGGALVNPYMLWTGHAMRYAVGTAAAAVFAISLFGSITYAISKPSITLSISHFGYVVWPAVLAVAIFSMSFAPLGAWLAYRLPTHILKKILGLILGVVAMKFLL